MGNSDEHAPKSKPDMAEKADATIKAGASASGKPEGSLAHGPDALTKAGNPKPTDAKPDPAP